MIAVGCNNLNKSFRSVKVLKNINVAIEENKIIGLIGRNGAGKTTLLKLIAGYLLPTEGNVKICGETGFNNMNRLSDLIYIGEELPYDKSMKLKDILEFGKLFYRNWNMASVNKLLKQFDLSRDLKYGNLSRGMKTKFNLAMGLGTRAGITIFDELTLGLDIAARRILYDAILNEYIDFPRTIILSGQLINEMENLLEEVIFIRQGEILLHKSVDEIQEYALYLEGRKETVLEAVKSKQIINSENFGATVKAAVVNTLTGHEAAELSAKGISVNKVALEELFIYLTKENERGEE